MSGPKRHHYVPNWYLRRFADKKRRVRVYSRVTGKTHLANTINAAVQSGFYALPAEDGGIDLSAEKMLAELEGTAKAALERVVSGSFPPSPEDRAVLSLFIANLMVRTPEFRDSNLAMIESLRDDLASAGVGPGQITEVFERSGIAAPTVRESVEWMFGVTGSIAPYLHARSWVLGRTPNRGVITSDHPVVVYKQQKRTAFRGAGVANADQVHFPIDPSTVLLLVHPNFWVPESQIALTSDNLLFEQSLMAAHSYEYIYQLPTEPLLPPAIVPTGPRPLFEMGDGSLVFAPRHAAD